MAKMLLKGICLAQFEGHEEGRLRPFGMDTWAHQAKSDLIDFLPTALVLRNERNPT